MRPRRCSRRASRRDRPQPTLAGPACSRVTAGSSSPSECRAVAAACAWTTGRRPGGGAGDRFVGARRDRAGGDERGHRWPPSARSGARGLARRAPGPRLPSPKFCSATLCPRPRGQDCCAPRWHRVRRRPAARAAAYPPLSRRRSDNRRARPLLARYAPGGSGAWLGRATAGCCVTDRAARLPAAPSPPRSGGRRDRLTHLHVGGPAGHYARATRSTRRRAGGVFATPFADPHVHSSAGAPSYGCSRG